MAYLGNAPVNGAFKKLDNISSSFNGVTTSFPLAVSTVAQSPGTAQNILISISGVLQEPQTAYTVSGSNIIFSEAPLATDTFFGVVLGHVGAVTTVTDDTISTAKIQDSAVTAAKLNSAAIKTINSASIIGYGDIVLQTPLVSGTNIKTVNSTSLLGSGNIATSYVPTSTAINKTLVPFEHCLVTAAGLTITLPTAVAGDEVAISVSDFTDTILARNGSTIVGVADDLVIDIANMTVTLRYVVSSWRIL